MLLKGNGKNFGIIPFSLLLVCLASGCTTTWQQKFQETLPVMGHRNWIVVADSAFPAYSDPGVEIIYTGEGQIGTLKTVLKAIDNAKHVRATVLLDEELAVVSEKDAPGIEAYCNRLNQLIKDLPGRSLPHDQILRRLDQTAKIYRVMMLKTDMTLPYTSVFLELDCGYWSSEAEERLREAFEK